ncbi:MAG TPA: menaquinone biosynthesis protein [Planctomycetaceae bacterium]|jgi:chorismate dehydratase|nr:menaquinone biosynthesis protein [Planctomycetaceae bacterium]
MTERLRVGGVSYLNSKPLLEDLPGLLPDAEVRLDYPSRLADDLTAGRLDVALIPSVEYFRGKNYEIVSDACVAARGPVLSVKLYTRKPWGEIGTLALDQGSRTSATLARILLAERYGVFPELQPLPLGNTSRDTDADAILLIGDRAMFPPDEKFVGTWDLGEEWFEWTGLPFVFAMWVARPNVVNHHLTVESALESARDRGVERLESIARREAPLLGLPLPVTEKYLTENLHYRMESAERSGLRWFYELAVRNGLAPQGVDLVFRNLARVG